MPMDHRALADMPRAAGPSRGAGCSQSCDHAAGGSPDSELYGVPTKVLNQAVKRNDERFPEDFMFRLSRAEAEVLNRAQSVTGSLKHRDPRFPPCADPSYARALRAPDGVDVAWLKST